VLTANDTTRLKTVHARLPKGHEGTNNKIKTMKRQAYGFRDPEFLKLKIYALHQTNYALVG